MAISFINDASNSSTGASSLAINKPTNTSEYDLMIAHIFVEDTTDRVNSVPENWNNIINATVGTRAIRTYVYWKIAGSSEGSNYTWGINASDELGGTIFTFRGTLPSGTPVGNYATSTDSTSSADCIAPGITVQTAYNWVMHISGMAYGTTIAAPTATPPTWSLDETNRSGTGPSNVAFAGSHAEYTSTGSTGDITAVGSASDYRVASLVELKLSTYVNVSKSDVFRNKEALD